MIIKVCGMRKAKNIRDIETLGIHLMGFIFWPKSSRYVNECPAYLPNKAKRVGVFVDEDIEQVKQIAHDYCLHIIQLHGHESPQYCTQLKDYHLIKAFNIATCEDLTQTKAYEGFADYFLFDTRKPAHETPGGTGEKFDWSVLSCYDGKTPFLLSGGIGPDDAERVKAFYHPQCIGIDLNSRFESTPGIKDFHKLKQFIDQL